MNTTKTATFIKQRNGNGDGRVYRVDPPMPVHDWPSDDHPPHECTGQGDCTTTDYVWVSAADDPFSGPETYVFPCDSEGRVTDWDELDGSFKGGLDHEAALDDAGYEVQCPDKPADPVEELAKLIEDAWRGEGTVNTHDIAVIAARTALDHIEAGAKS